MQKLQFLLNEVRLRFESYLFQFSFHPGVKPPPEASAALENFSRRAEVKLLSFPRDVYRWRGSLGTGLNDGFWMADRIIEQMREGKLLAFELNPVCGRRALLALPVHPGPERCFFRQEQIPGRQSGWEKPPHEGTLALSQELTAWLARTTPRTPNGN